MFIIDVVKEDHNKFLVAGIITSEEFQKCRYAVLKLHKTFPKTYVEPEIRPMLNMEWEEYLTKMRRKIGKGLWSLTSSVAVFLNDTFMGDDKTLLDYISKKYIFKIHEDWGEIGKQQLILYLSDIMDNFRQLVYITIEIDAVCIGTMLFQLYNDIVPLTCENFMERCTKNPGGYGGTPIHRIVEGSWIQCGGWNLEPKKMPCENYAIPHDRRGVLSMCNNGRHTDNSTQFYITLASAPWMDYNYVAFGQLLQGAEILKRIEQVLTYRQSPTADIKIIKTGEFVLRPEESDMMTKAELDICIKEALEDTVGSKDDVIFHDADSFFKKDKFMKGMYCLDTDLRSYSQFIHLPDYLMKYLKCTKDVSGECDCNCNVLGDDFSDDPCESKNPPPTPSPSQPSFIYPRFKERTKSSEALQNVIKIAKSNMK